MGKVKKEKLLKRRWTEKEDLYLENNWGSRSVADIAKKLKRTPNAVRLRSAHINLGPFREAQDFISISKLGRILKGGPQKGSSSIVHKLRLHNCPTTILCCKGSKGVECVSLEKFWKWLENHKREFSFKRVNLDDFGYVPAWAYEKKKIDFQRYSVTVWSDMEISILKNMVAHQASVQDIAARLNRSYFSVRTRIRLLGLSIPRQLKKPKYWTQEEIDEAVRMFDEGYSNDDIAKKLNRSISSIALKIHQTSNKKTKSTRKLLKERQQDD